MPQDGDRAQPPPGDLPCPSCGHRSGGTSPCPRCGVSFSPVLPPPPPPTRPADFTRVLAGLGVLAALLIGAALGWRARGPGPSPRPALAGEASGPRPALVGEAPAPRPALAGEESAPRPALAGEASDPRPALAGEASDPRPALAREASAPSQRGMTAAELLAWDEPEAPPTPAERPDLDLSPTGARPALVASSGADLVGWYEGAAGYERAREERARRPTTMIVYFHTPWCPYCRRLDDEFLADDEVASWLNQTLRVQINPEDGPPERALARAFHLDGYPGFFVLPAGSDDPRRVHPFRHGHTESASQFLSELKVASGPAH